MTEPKKWCFAWYAEPVGPSTGERAALEKANRWTVKTIKIGFMGGTPAQHALVRKYAVGWIDAGAKLTFSWVTLDQADIRISFVDDGSWSVIGKSAKKVPKNEATMNFGWLTPDVSEAEARSVILHEFGHALGLIHEHQNPLGAINWNKDAVYGDLSGPPNDWSKTTIDHNMFEAYPKHQIDGTPVDPASIMMYPIPASWVNPPSIPVGFNSDLSSKDRAFIAKTYK